jgi:hypothetical protein
MIMVFIGARLAWSTSTFLAINVGMAAIWLGFAVLIGREHLRRAGGQPHEEAPPAAAPSNVGVPAVPATAH